MANDLVAPDELTDFPGAPFTDDAVDAAAATLRSLVEWHVAPERSETLTVDSVHDCVLVLPTLKIGAVTEVRDVTSADPVVITEWRVRRNSMLARDSGWPCRRLLDALEVDLTHGYTVCPSDLLPVLAELALLHKTNGTLSQVRLGDVSESYRVGGTTYPNRSTLSRYRINIH